MFIEGLKRKFIRYDYFQRIVAVYAAAQLTVLLSIATLWVLAQVPSNRVAITWGLWASPNLICVGWAALMYMMYGPETTNIFPSLLTFMIGLATSAANLAALIWFGVIYHDCRSWTVMSNSDPGYYWEPVPDPLCSFGTWNIVSIYYMILSCIAMTLNLTLFLGGIGGMSFLLLGRKYKEAVNDPLESFKELIASGGGGNVSKLKRDGFFMYALNFTMVGAMLLMVEWIVLTGNSLTKHLFWGHIPELLLVAVTFTPAIRSIVFNKFARLASLFSISTSTAVLICSILYYVWNCKDSNPSTHFGTEECNVSSTGAVYAIILHAVFTAIAGARLFVFQLLYQNQFEGPKMLDWAQQDVTSDSFAPYSRNLIKRRNMDNYSTEDGMAVESKVTPGSTVYI